MKTLLFEQWQGGHYFNYLECLIPALAEFSGEVVAAVTERAAASELFARQLAPLTRLANVRFDPTVPFPEGSGLAFRRQLGTNLLAAIDRHRPDFVFLPSADEQLLALPLLSLARHRRGLRDVAIEAVIHYPSYTQSAGVRQRVVGAAQRGLLRSGVFSQLHFVNYLQYEDVQAQRWWWQRRARAAGVPCRSRRGSSAVLPASRSVSTPRALSRNDRRPRCPQVCSGDVGGVQGGKLPPPTVPAGWPDDARYAKLVREDYADLSEWHARRARSLPSDPELAQVSRHSTCTARSTIALPVCRR